MPISKCLISSVLCSLSLLAQDGPHAADTPAPEVPAARYDPALFQKPIPKEQAAFLAQTAGAPSGDVLTEKAFRKMAHGFVPDCLFHYGHDMSLANAIDLVMKKSPDQVAIREGRYVTLSGQNGPYLGGRGFLWIDLHDGIALGAFFFRPTNGEPTPSLVVFSKQMKEQTFAVSQLPPAFIEDLNTWSAQKRIPHVTTRYFINGSNRRILLEHDQDYCAAAGGAPPQPHDACIQMDMDAADMDETAAYYLKQVNYATNATAWMIGADQLAWLDIRAHACGGVLDPIGCRIRVTREHTHVIVHGHK